MPAARPKALLNRIARSALMALAFMLFAFPALALDEGPFGGKFVSVRLFADKTHVTAGETITIGIEETIAPHWHVYWANPGDSGEPTRLTWTGLEGIKTGEILWPAPTKLPIGPLTNYGYENSLTLLQDITLPPVLPEGAFTLTADYSLLVCEEICIPEFGQAAITFNDGVERGDTAKISAARQSLPESKAWNTSYSSQNGNIRITIHHGGEGDGLSKRPESIALFPLAPGLLANAAAPSITLSDDGLTIIQTAGEIPAAEIPASDFVLTYADDTGNRKSVALSATLEGATPQSGKKEEMGFIAALLFAFLGGVILNLMPCVFPVLSLKALSLIHLNGQEENKARLHGLAYAAGVIISFMAVAAVLIALKAQGESIGWGFQLQNPAVVLALSFLVFLIGLNLIGFFEIGGSFTNFGARLVSGNKMSGSFFTGVLATLVATPCSAPFMAGAVGYALLQSPAAALAVFAALGFGLAFPYLALCYIPSLRNALPRPGAWMNTFRQFLAFPMFATAAWLLWVLGNQAGATGELYALLGMVALSFGLWIAKNAGGRTLLKVIAALVILAGLSPIFLVRTADTASSSALHQKQEQSADNWSAFSESSYEQALASPRPVFINMTASWCITCKVNERLALNTRETRALFTEKDVLYLKGDWTSRDETITKYLERYGRSGVPLYVYYGRPDPATGKRPEPIVLPQILTPGTVRDALQ